MIWKPNVTVAAVVEQNGKYLLVEEEPEVGSGLFLNQPADKEQHQADSAKNHGNNPETHGHRGFRPAQRLKMMMDRRGKKNLLTPQFFTYHLDNN